MIVPIKTTKEKPIGNATFLKVFEKNSHPDDWGVPCMYDYAAWRVWKAAVRFERRRKGKGE